MDRPYKVYCHTNKINGKKYVGMTKQKPNRRWRNGKAYSRSYHFGRAIAKYGWDNFSHEVLYEGLTKEEAITKEIELIAKWNLTNPDVGYNGTSGGENTTFSPDAVGRLSKSLKKFYEDENNYSKLVKQNRMRFINDPTLKQRLSDAHKGLQVTPIKCSNGQVYQSVQEASEALRIHKNSISGVLNGRQHTAHGLTFEYINKEDKDKCASRRNKEHKIPRSYRMVECINTGKIYKTCREAEVDLGISRGKVSWVCNNPKSTAKGYSFRYVKSKQKVMCLNSGKIYKDSKEASKELNVPSSRIGEVCRGSRKSVGGYFFKYVGELE